MSELRGVRDPAAGAQRWAEDETSRMVTAGDPARGGAADLGETYGVAVGWGPAPAQQPDGQVRPIAAWFVSLTRPGPGTGMLSTCDPVGSPEPDEGMTRAKVRAGITALRALYATQAAAANGQPQ